MKATFFTQLYVNQTVQNNMHSDLSEAQNSAGILRQFEYVRNMGSFKPRFEGIPDEYFPLTASEVFKYSIFVFLVIVCGLGIMIGFLFWVMNAGLNGYTIVWSTIFLVFAAIMMFFFYVGGKGRIKQEKRLIQRQQEKQAKLQNKLFKKKQQNNGIEE